MFHHPERRLFNREPEREDTQVKPYNQTQQFFLLRLMKLMDQRNDSSPREGWQDKLLDRAIYSTFVDCREQGVGDDAKVILNRHDQIENRDKK